MKNLVKIRLRETNDNVLSYESGVLTLKKAGEFSVVIMDYDPAAPSSAGSEREKDSEYQRIRWLWHTVRSALAFEASDFNVTLKQGVPEQTISFPEFLEGGGMTYIEAFVDGIAPANSLTKGMLVQAIGTPEILAVKWTTYDEEGQVRDLAAGTKLPLGSTVQLHIYTQGLYGQNIVIQLMDDDSFIFKESSNDDILPPFERPTELKAGEYPEMPKEDERKVFKREVSTYPLTDETIPTHAKRGNLVIERGGTRYKCHRYSKVRTKCIYRSILGRKAVFRRNGDGDLCAGTPRKSAGI